MKINFFILSLGLALAACTPSGVTPGGEPVSAQVSKPVASHQQLRQDLSRLPGVQLSAEDPLIVSYPAGALFGETALLPMPGGSGSLDALATLIRQYGLKWRVIVRASTGEGESYDLQLATERLRILKTYLQQVGVDMKLLSMQAVAEEGAPLELSLFESAGS